jgi:dethiobiotin synthetase
MSYFVTGTDTDVGKTLISCALLYGFAAQGKRVAGMKPVAAGRDPAGQNEDVLRLQAASNVAADLRQTNPYSFEPAVAPHLAARLAGIRIDIGHILESCAALSGQADVVIVEGAGGFLVPLNEVQDAGDLARQLGLPVILVVGMRLGCLNHALLTVEAIRLRGLPLAGWVANVIAADMPLLEANIAALQQRITAPLLGTVPYMPGMDGRAASGYLDLKLLAQV